MSASFCCSSIDTRSRQGSQEKQETGTAAKRWAERWKGKRRAQTRLRCVCNKFSFKVASSGVAGSRDLSRVTTMLLRQALQFGLFSALCCVHYPNKSVGISSEVSTRGAVTPCPARSHKNGKYPQLLPGMRKIAFPSTLEVRTRLEAWRGRKF